jgi:lipopolysaccharide/colanic/teichoic acid biosynthesis glycosyltransferase
MLQLRTTLVDGGSRAAERANPRNDGRPIVTRLTDSRTSRVGRALRATSIDELPRFWNVLRGDMSVIGPFPQRPEDIGDRRHDLLPESVTVRPGLTGLWRVREGSIDRRNRLPGGRASTRSARRLDAPRS